MKKDCMPQSRLGKWAVGIGVASVIAMMLELFLAMAIGGDAAVIEASPWLSALAAMLSIALTIAGPLSLVIGIIAFIKHKERPVVKCLAVIYAIDIITFLLGEFLFPH